MAETILVTGGAGFIGSHLVDALVAQGHTVRVFDNLEPQVHGSLREQGRWPAYCHPEAEYILGDVRDRATLLRALAGVDRVSHQAALVGVGQSMYQVERYVDVNSRGTATLLDILVNEPRVRARMRKLVVASSMSIYGEGACRCVRHGQVRPPLRSEAQLARQEWELRCPLGEEDEGCGLPLQHLPTTEEQPLQPVSTYAVTKRDQEELCLVVGRAYAIPAVALRYFSTYGSRQALSNPYTGVAAIFCSRVLNGKPPILFEDGGQMRDLVHVSDIVQANLVALAADGPESGAYNVGTGTALAILELAQTLIVHLGSDLVPEVTGQFRAGDIRHCYPDIASLAHWGFEPRISFAEGVAELVSWVRSQQAVDTFDAARQELETRGLAT